MARCEPGFDVRGLTMARCEPGFDVRGFTMARCRPAFIVPGLAMARCKPASDVPGLALIRCEPEFDVLGFTMAQCKPAFDVPMSTMARCKNRSRYSWEPVALATFHGPDRKPLGLRRPPPNKWLNLPGARVLKRKSLFCVLPAPTITIGRHARPAGRLQVNHRSVRPHVACRSSD